jgi:hypothetical protein
MRECGEGDSTGGVDILKDGGKELLCFGSGNFDVLCPCELEL